MREKVTVTYFSREAKSSLGRQKKAGPESRLIRIYEFALLYLKRSSERGTGSAHTRGVAIRVYTTMAVGGGKPEVPLSALLLANNEEIASVRERTASETETLYLAVYLES